MARAISRVAMPSETGRPDAKSWRILVIGCGSIGQRHIGNLLALGVTNLLAFDPRPDRRREAEARFGIETVEDLPRAWAADPEVALIAAPTSLHVQLALEAAEHGCHLFIEKPLSDRLDAAVDRLLALVQARRLVTLVGCNMRFHPTLRHVKTLCTERAIGHLVAARVEAGQYLPDWHPWEDYRDGYSAQRRLGGGVILDAIHELDYLRWLLGGVAAVAAFAGRLSGLAIDTEDVASMILRFTSGAIGHVHLDYIQRAYSKSCHLIGEEGTIRWDFTAGQTRWFRAATRQWETVSNPEGWEPNQMYLEEMRHFLRCLRGEESSAQDVMEGARVLEIAVGAKTAAAEGRVVALSGRAGGRLQPSLAPTSLHAEG